MIKLKELLTEEKMLGVAKEDKNSVEKILKNFGIKTKILKAKNMPKRIVYSIPDNKIMKLIDILDNKRIFWMISTKGGMN